MALTPPTVEAWEEFRNEQFATDDNNYTTLMLERSTDAVWLTTGLDSYPTDPRMQRIVEYAIFDLSEWLLAQAEHRDEINSPFSSERIGSYSYSKMQQAMKSGGGTGLYWVDMLAKMLTNVDDVSGAFGIVSERVFNPEGYSYEQERILEKHVPLGVDPSEPWGF